MTFIDAITALIILGVFLFGFSGAFLPAHDAWNRAMIDYRTAQTINFIAESFKDECAKPDRNIENWKKTVSAAKELEGHGINELKQGNVLQALKLTCIISGERLEIIGLCNHE